MNEYLRINCDFDFDKNKEKDKCFEKIDKNCCCDIDTLRKILEVFHEENISVLLITNAGSFSGYIFDLTKDMAFIAVNPVTLPNIFVPLCNIVRVDAEISPELVDSLIDRINNLIRFNCNSTQCCCTDGIADTVNSINRFTQGLICFVLHTTVSLDNCFDIDAIEKVTGSIVFIADGSVFSILPTCGINSISIEVD